MNAEPLSKNIYNKAIELGVEKIHLNFSGGSDEGCLYVRLEPWDGKMENLEREIDEWAWNVYSYSGVGEGNDYGDDITYDLVNKRVEVSEWYTTRQEGHSDSDDLEIAEADDAE